MAGTYTVKPNDSWASIAGSAYGNQRWLNELARANGMTMDTMLHPGMVIQVPDFDLTQTPYISASEWAGAPTGVQGGQTQYGNSAPAVPNFGTPAVPSFNNISTAGAGATANKPAGGSKQTKTFAAGASPYTDQLNRMNGVGGTGAMGPARPPVQAQPNPLNPAPASNPAMTGRPGLGSPALGPSVLQQAQNMGAAPKPPQANMGGRSMAGQRPMTQSPYRAQLDRMNGTGGTQQMGPATPPGYNYAPQPGSGQGPRTAGQGLDGPMSYADLASAARWTGMALYAFGGGYGDTDRYGRQLAGNRSILPNRISLRVSQELPLGNFTSVEEMMAAFGYMLDADGNWTLHNPRTIRGYGGGTQYGGGAQYVDYGGGGYGGGLTRGPASVGYQGLGLTNWRISG